jgi:uncharacterized membrane protein/heat shock protein HslJ
VAQNTGDNNINKIIQTKASEGIDFYALGNEPFWSLDMDFENEFQFKNLDGLTIIVPAERGAKAMDAEVTRYRSVNDTHEIIIQAQRQDCSDTMSDNKFDYKVNIDYKKIKEKNYTKLSGCGNFVPDYRLNNIWAIENIDNKNLNEIEFMKGQPYIEIIMIENRISGHDGCNNIMGGFRYENGYIIIGNLAGTRMACPNLEISNQISKTLSNKKIAYDFIDGKLYFIYQSKIIMTLKNID